MTATLILKYLATFIISMVPIIELRGAIPIAVGALHLGYLESLIISIIGNIIPIYFIIKYIGPVFDFFEKFKIFKKPISWLKNKTTKKIEKNPKLQDCTAVALFIFVAIPLPGTGAWTGSMIANFLHIPMKKSFLPISLGVACAGLIMLIVTAITKGGIQFLLG